MQYREGINVDYAIVTEKLVKKFGDFTAVDGLNLRIIKGELFGFLGPNGAGKTTTIKMLTTLLEPTSGSATVAGFDVIRRGDEVRDRIGVVPQSFALFEELTPMENLNFIGELYSMDRKEIVKRSEELLTTVTLLEKKDVPCKGFSGGMKQRLSVAAGLLHEPQILFMDEPTTGLDPQSRIALRDLTRKLNQSGITIVYTTHDMEEADKLCDRIAIMDHGKMITEGTPEELKNKYGSGHRITLELAQKPGEDLLRALKKQFPASKVLASGNRVELHSQSIGGALVHHVSDFMSKRKVNVSELLVEEPSLEEVFINLTDVRLRD